MTVSRTSIILIGLLFGLTSFGQTADVRGIDKALTSTFKTMVAADYDLRNDSLAPAFKKQTNFPAAEPPFPDSARLKY